ncbi:MAG: hypothetical protein AB8H47_05145 [Bacteroidia bacterium]
MSLLQNIGWYGLTKLQVWEINEAGEILGILSVRKAHNQLLIESYQSPAKYPDQLSPHIPILLALRIDNIIEAKFSLNETDIVSSLLGVPMEDKSDFVWQANPLDDTAQWACLLRRQSLDNVWQNVSSFSQQILYLNLSKNSLRTLLPTPSENDSLSDAVDLQKLSDELEVSEEALYPYSVAMQFLRYQGQDLHGLEWDLGLAQSFKQTSKWLKSLSLLSGISLLLMTSLMLGQSFLSVRLAERQNKIQQKQNLLQEVDSLSTLLNEQQVYLSQSQKGFQISRSSYWLDRTASEAPLDLRFEKWVYAPSPAQCKKLGFETDTAPKVIIKGIAQTAGSISAFAKGVQSQAPKHKVELHQSQYDLQQQRYQFLLLIL